MKRDFRAYLLGTVCLVACVANAQAGGLMEPRGSMKDNYIPPIGGGMKDTPMIAPTSGGWYLRGDVGYTRYGNVGGYIGEHQTYVVDDYNNNCRSGDYNDLQYVDNSDVANGGDGYYYWNRRTSDGVQSQLRFRPDATTDASGAAIPMVDADGVAIAGSTVDDANVEGSSAGLWQEYRDGGWHDVAAVYHDNDPRTAAERGDDALNGAQHVLIADGTGGWSGSSASTASTLFGTQDLVNVVRGISTVLSEEFLEFSAQNIDMGREPEWLNMAASHASQTLCNVGRSVLHNVDIDNTWNIGGGVGYYFTNNWRGDLTFDYRFGADVRATDTFLDSWGTTSIRAYHDTELSSFVTLANLYYDFGDRRGFSPYIGGGLGFSVNRLDDRKITCDYIGPDDASWSDCGGSTLGAGDSNVSVAAAAMVGFSQALSSNVKLDAGYRFLYLGDAKSGNELAGADDGSQGQLVLEDITAHEFRIGIRYEFGGRR